MQTITSFLVPLLILVGLSACFSTLAAEVSVGDTAPELEITTVYGPDGVQEEVDGTPPLTLESLRGKVVLLDFWATWCVPCIASIPKINGWHQDYAERGLVIIGHTDGSSQNLDEFIPEREIKYLITVGPDLGRDFGVTAVPAAFLIDVDGTIAWAGNPAHLTNETIEKLLANVDDADAAGAGE